MNARVADRHVKALTQQIVEGFDPEKVILFGSRAWGKANEDSDFDLFVVKKTKNTRKTAMEIDDCLFPRSAPLDILVYTPEQALDESDDFLQQILNKGRVLYER